MNMQCPSCGADIPNPYVPYCPRCGQSLREESPGQRRAVPSGPRYAPDAPPYQEGGDSGARYAFGTRADQPEPGGAPEQPWPSGPGQSYGGYGAAAPPSGYGVPPAVYGPPSQGQMPPPGFPGAGGPAYPPPYYPGAPMSVPLTTPGGGPMYPPGYPQQPYWSPPPPPPPRKSRTGLIVGIVVAVTLVVCVAGAAVLYAIGNSQTNSLNTQSQGTATAITQTAVASGAPTPTPPTTIAYQNSLTSGASGWANDQHCFPSNDGYHIKDGYVCYAPAGDQANVDVTVSVSQASGSTLQGYGISVRRTAHVGNGYDFLIDSNSKWAFFRCDQANCTTLVDFR